MHKPDVRNLKNHLPSEGPVVHRGHAAIASMTMVTEFTVHALEMRTFAILIIIVTFSKDLWEAIDICLRKCKIN